MSPVIFCISAAFVSSTLRIASLTAATNMSESVSISSVDYLGLEVDREDLLLAVDLHADRAAARAYLIFARVELLLQRFHISLHLLRLPYHCVHVLGTAAHSLG